MPRMWKAIYVDNDGDANVLDRVWLDHLKVEGGVHSLEWDNDWDQDKEEDSEPTDHEKRVMEAIESVRQVLEVEMIPLDRAAQILAGAIGAGRFIAGTVPNGSPIADEALVEECCQTLRRL